MIELGTDVRTRVTACGRAPTTERHGFLPFSVVCAVPFLRTRSNGLLRCRRRRAALAILGLVLAQTAAPAQSTEVIDLFSSQAVPDLPATQAEKREAVTVPPRDPRLRTSPEVGKATPGRPPEARLLRKGAGLPSRQSREAGGGGVRTAGGSPAKQDAEILDQLKKLLAHFGIREPEEPKRFYGADQRPTPVWTPARWAEDLLLEDARIRSLRREFAELGRRIAPGSCLLWPLEQEYLLAPFPEMPLMLPGNAFSRHVAGDHDRRAAAERLRRLAPGFEELFGILEHAPPTLEEDPWKRVPDPVRLAFADGPLVSAVADRAPAPPDIPPPRFRDGGDPPDGNRGSPVVRHAARRLELALLGERIEAQMGLARRLAGERPASGAPASLEAEAEALRAELDERMAQLARPAASDGGREAEPAMETATLDARYLELRARIAALSRARGASLSGAADPTDFLTEYLETAAHVCPPIWRRIRLRRESRASAPDLRTLLFAGLDRSLVEVGGRCRLLADDLVRLASTAEDGRLPTATNAYLESRIAGSTAHLLAAAVFYYLRSAQRLAVLATRALAGDRGADPLFDTKAILEQANRDIAYALRSHEVTNEPEAWLDPPTAIRLLFEWHRQVRSDRPDVLDELRKAERELLFELVQALRNAETRLRRAFEGGAPVSCGADLAVIGETRRAGRIDADRAALWRRAVAARFDELLELARVVPHRRAFLGSVLVPRVQDALRPGEVLRLPPFRQADQGARAEDPQTVRKAPSGESRE